jgi:exopolyphosphatase/guanosine-5'-triphosphate,3'-diphosphate pyrophosphatase
MRRRGKQFPSVGGYEMDRSEVRHILEHLRTLSLRDRKAVPGLHADRADIIVAGVTVIERLLKYFKVNRLLINDQGVRDGLLLRMIGQSFASRAKASGDDGDPLTGVRQFAAACTADQRHPEHIAYLAGRLFDQLQAPLRLPPEERLILEAAALLHEIGYLIHYEKHHLHSMHLILHGNVRGLAPRQRELVANVARYHRRATPKRKHDNFNRLLPSERDIIRRQSAILRLADGFDRTHTQNVQGLRCDWRNGELVLTAVAGHDPEVDLWSAREKGEFFERVFGVRLTIRGEPGPESNGVAKG